MTPKKIIIGMLSLLLAFSFSAHAQSSFDRGSYIVKGDTLPYRLLFPKHFNPAKKYPLLFVLHGAGERGNNNEAQLKYGPERLLQDSVREKYEAIVVFPQCPANSYWSNVKQETDAVTQKRKFIFQINEPPTKAMQLLMGLVDQFLDKPFVNKQRVYIGGLSMGGMGTFEIIGREPKIFAAAFAICGGDNTLNAKKYAKKVPLWIFHGTKDSVVPVEHSEVMVSAIKDAGGNPNFTLYPGVDHNSWENAFREPELLSWLFSHSK
ncbi:prolyl oligopeptidase family serine peptidase [Mucilaginibacter sp. SP1R1]|uniref:carboxylesterase family protein n=1 Tax=Mucilaginibacter sp. SP1R1 TaxID=2723091 RepID=UPI00161FF5BB|nr:prolyl oligopeptidase family serine peptidase [Mucilaginibacter sp. SP1R1]MBB6152183.1 putative peptidase [Mucilaginibacter sp. SP1R1]